MAKINIHSSLMRFTNNQSQIDLEVNTAATIISMLCEHYPRLKSSILNADGVLTPYINIYINGKNLTHCPSHLSLASHDQIDVVTALVGG